MTISSKAATAAHWNQLSMLRHLSARHHAAGVPLLTKAHILAFWHKVVVYYVFPLIGVCTERYPVIIEQAPVLMVGTGAHPLVRHINQVAEIALVHHLRLHAQRQAESGIFSWNAKLIQRPQPIFDVGHNASIDVVGG